MYLKSVFPALLHQFWSVWNDGTHMYKSLVFGDEFVAQGMHLKSRLWCWCVFAVGSTAAAQRQQLWRSKRVFFLTPQVMVNDLSRGTCPAAQVRCVVIDEAHKATGNHAFCQVQLHLLYWDVMRDPFWPLVFVLQVIRELCNQTQQFRVLALSATPGGDVKVRSGERCVSAMGAVRMRVW